MNELNSLVSLKNFIIEQTLKAFENGGTGLFLSQLGTLIKSAQLHNSLGTQKLADFITEEMADTIQIISHPESSHLKIALPVTVPMGNNVMKFIPKRNSALNSPRYKSRFWAAFSQPLPNGYTRWIEFEPELRFFDDNNGEFSITDTLKSISSEFIISQAQIVELTSIQLSQKIVDNIQQWLSDNQIAFDLVKAQNADTKVWESHKESLLEVLMTSLDEADLKRIQIPLDIIAKLHRKR